MKDDPLAAPLPPPLPPVDLADLGTRQRWLSKVRDRLAEIMSTSLEATGPKRLRILSRAEARRSIKEAGAVLVTLIDAAEALPETTAGEPDEDKSEDHTFTVMVVKQRPGGALL